MMRSRWSPAGVVALGLLLLPGGVAQAQDGRDSVIDRARLLAGSNRTDQARNIYAAWLATHPDDAEAWRELGREELKAGRPAAAARALDRSLALEPHEATADRLELAQALAAPAVEPVFGGSRDSDGNVLSRVGFRADLALADGARVGIVAARSTLADGLDTGSDAGIAVFGRWRPRAALSFEWSGGARRVESSARALAPATLPSADLRMRFRAPGNGPRLDLRGRHEALAVSPMLIANRVTRSEVSARVDLPAGPVWLRAMGRLGALDALLEINRRSLLGGGIAVPVSGAAEISGQVSHLAYDEPSSSGYFAPRLAQMVEAGSYAEVYPLPRWAVALDLGAGVQRVAQHGAPAGSWRGAFRLWALSSLRLQPGRDLVLELEAYDAPLATAAAVTSEGWRWGSASLSLRWGL
ncbi:MAG: tetratricopeptide repeat protein [Gemmatimonadetes bacterium]|nr:tetratricopeptide repeat protein [Gemmatimonadota bacterium]